MGAYKEIAIAEVYRNAAGETQVHDSVRICPSFGVIYYTSVDLGYPAVRSATQELPQADGVLDQTAYTGARSVSIGLKILNNAFGDLPTKEGWSPLVGWNSASWWVRYLSSWVTASRRVRLYLRDDTGHYSWMPLVGNQAPSAVSRESAWNRDMLLSFTNPTGKLYSFSRSQDATMDGRNVVRVRQTNVQVAGRPYPQVYEPWPDPPPPASPYPQKTYPPRPGATNIIYEGSVSNGFLARVHVVGSIAMEGPAITVTAPDDSVSEMALSPLLELAPGTIVEFDSNAKTIRSYPASSPSTVSDRDGYKIGALTWPQLKPGFKIGYPQGRNLIEFTMTAGDPECYAEIFYQNADLY
jgi:hypothetical protein